MKTSYTKLQKQTALNRELLQPFQITEFLGHNITYSTDRNFKFSILPVRIPKKTPIGLNITPSISAWYGQSIEMYLVWSFQHFIIRLMWPIVMWLELVQSNFVSTLLCKLRTIEHIISFPIEVESAPANKFPTIQ